MRYLQDRTGSGNGPAERLGSAIVFWAAAVCLATTGAGADPPHSFGIDNGMITRDGAPVFFNMIGYHPYEPGQDIGEALRPERLNADLEYWRAYALGSDPVAVRLYPQVSAQIPGSFYDGLRDLGFFVVRDIYFDEEHMDLEDAKRRTDAVLQEVADAGAGDLVLAWEIGNECRGRGPGLADFLTQMSTYIRTRVPQVVGPDVSTWVTWASYPGHDTLWTDPYDYVVAPDCFDLNACNAYSYWPERLRDHQAGPVTGTPYAGYLATLKASDPGKPLIISECGYSDSPAGSPPPEQACLRPTYPCYRYGGLTTEQAAEALEARYWDARLSGTISGFDLFEWNDEWRKGGNPDVQDPMPEQHFGVMRFEEVAPGEYQLQPKPQEAVLRRLYTLDFDESLVQSLDASHDEVTGRWSVSAVLADDVTGTVHMRWETERGFVLGSSTVDTSLTKTATALFRTGDRRPYLGSARVTAIAVSADGRADYDAVTISPVGPLPLEASIELLTFSEGDVGWARASGRVRDVDLDVCKLIVYVKTNRLYVQPYAAMKDIFIDASGYWWTNVGNLYDGELCCWLVPREFEPPDQAPLGWEPDAFLAFASMAEANDVDADLLPDDWEVGLWGDIGRYGRYDDPDEDWSYNLEEFLAGTSPDTPDDSDGDGLWDAFEFHYFGTLLQGPADDPDGDGTANAGELARGTDPSRAVVPEPAAVTLLAVGFVLSALRYGYRRMG